MTNLYKITAVKTTRYTVYIYIYNSLFDNSFVNENERSNERSKRNYLLYSIIYKYGLQKIKRKILKSLYYQWIIYASVLLSFAKLPRVAENYFGMVCEALLGGRGTTKLCLASFRGSFSYVTRNFPISISS